jgi:hypothetical protein
MICQHIDLRRAGKLVDSDWAEDLALGFVHESITRTYNLVDLRHRFSAEGHGRDSLRAANAKDTVGARHVTARNHRLVRVWR